MYQLGLVEVSTLGLDGLEDLDRLRGLHLLGCGLFGNLLRGLLGDTGLAGDALHLLLIHGEKIRVIIMSMG